MTMRRPVHFGRRSGAVLALLAGCAVSLVACFGIRPPPPGVDITRIVYGTNFEVPTDIPPVEINQVCRRSGPLTTCDYNYSSRDWAARFADPGKAHPQIRKDVGIAFNCGSGTVGIVAYFTGMDDVPFHFDCSAPQSPHAYCGPTLDNDPRNDCVKPLHP